jgi:nitrous oxide reductase accessory protein NosL
MKALRLMIPTVLAGVLLALVLASCSKEESVANAKPYPLETCLVCDMKLSMMGKPLTFAYQGQQIQVCDVSEKEAFEKDPAKYIKKLAEAEAALKK